MKQEGFSGSRLAATWASYRSLPLWVQIWVGLILVPVNVAPFFFLDTWTGKAAALAAVFVAATNLPIMLWYAGMNAAMAIPHLIAWIPLEIVLIMRLTGDAGPDTLAAPEATLAWVMLIINGISLAFDLPDTWHWFRGDRATPRPD